MRSYLVEVYTPESRAQFKDTVARLKKVAQVMTREGLPITYRRSILLPGDETCFHLLDGPSKAAVAEAARRAAVDSPRVVEALQ